MLIFCDWLAASAYIMLYQHGDYICTAYIHFTAYSKESQTRENLHTHHTLSPAVFFSFSLFYSDWKIKTAQLEELVFKCFTANRSSSHSCGLWAGMIPTGGVREAQDLQTLVGRSEQGWCWKELKCNFQCDQMYCGYVGQLHKIRKW